MEKERYGFKHGDLVRLRPRSMCSRGYQAPAGSLARIYLGDNALYDNCVFVVWVKKSGLSQLDGDYPANDFQLVKRANTKKITISRRGIKL